MTRHDVKMEYPALLVRAAHPFYGGSGYSGTIQRIPFKDAGLDDIQEIWRCQHIHRLARKARECAASEAIRGVLA